MTFSALSDTAALEELARRAAGERLARGLSQDELAALAGVGRSTVQRLERGESIQLASFIKLLRALGRLDALGDAVLPPPAPSPLDLLAQEQQRRKRAPRATHPGPATDAPPASWQWGDETGRDTP